MPVTACADDARPSRRRANSNGADFWLTSYIGANRYAASAGDPPAPGSIYPMAFLVEQDAGAVVGAHYHQADQFQVVVGGTGRLGRHDVAPGAIHYAGAWSPYARWPPAPTDCSTSRCATAGIQAHAIWSSPTTAQHCVRPLGTIARLLATACRPRMVCAHNTTSSRRGNRSRDPSHQPARASSGSCCPATCCAKAGNCRYDHAYSSTQMNRPLPPLRVPPVCAC